MSHLERVGRIELHSAQLGRLASHLRLTRKIIFKHTSMPGIGSGRLAFYQGFALTRSVFEYANSLWTGFEPVSGVYFHWLSKGAYVYHSITSSSRGHDSPVWSRVITPAVTILKHTDYISQPTSGIYDLCQGGSPLTICFNMASCRGFEPALVTLKG